ncbi:hypothetical protein MMC10_004665 [Thelotrema lepadinum]|nr:hypothetical protein [Thelotrema lepadinum]
MCPPNSEPASTDPSKLDPTMKAPKGPDFHQIALENEEKRDVVRPPAKKLILKNVRVFDGNQIGQPTSIAIENGRIVDDVKDAEELDCAGKVLLPGLIDAHTHPLVFSELEKMARHGITTTMCMAGMVKSHMDSLRNHIGVTDVRMTGVPAAGPDNMTVKFIANWPMDETLTDVSQAEAWVDRQLSKGAEYIKILADIPGMSQAIVTGIVDAAKKRNKLVVCHAPGHEPARQGLKAGAHQLHHSPLDGTFSQDDIELYKNLGTINCPTLSIMQLFAKMGPPRPGRSYANARDNVALLHKAGIPILAGTDANETPASPIHLPFGESFHNELQLLVEASLSNIDVLRAATILPAKYFNLDDRGVVAPGYRADLVLLSGNPLEDIAATKNIEKVWIGGIEVE